MLISSLWLVAVVFKSFDVYAFFCRMAYVSSCIKFFPFAFVSVQLSLVELGVGNGDSLAGTSLKILLLTMILLLHSIELSLSPQIYHVL